MAQWLAVCICDVCFSGFSQVTLHQDWDVWFLTTYLSPIDSQSGDTENSGEGQILKL
jgi:hypothetical protein